MSESQSHSRITEDIDLENVNYVPDTPDRLASCGSKIMERAEKKNVIYSRGYSRSSGCRGSSSEDILSHGKLKNKAVSYKGSKFKIPRNSTRDALEDLDDPIFDTRPNNPSELQDVIPGKPDHSLKSCCTDFARASSSMPFMMPTSVASTSTGRYTKTLNSHGQRPQKLSLQDTTELPYVQDKRKGSLERYTSNNANGAFRMCGQSSKGHEYGTGKPEEESCFHQTRSFKTQESVLNCVQIIDSPRVRGPKRLVHNGCISPYNIAKEKGMAEGSKISVVSERKKEGIPVHMSPCVIDSSAEGKSCGILKGERERLHQGTLKEVDTRVQNSYDSFAAMDAVDYNAGTEDDEGVGSWRQTHRHLPMIGHSPSNKQSYASRVKNNDGGTGSQSGGMKKYGTRGLGGEYHLTEVKIPSVGEHPPHVPPRISCPSSGSNVASKRGRETDSFSGIQRTKLNLTTTENGEPSSSCIDDADILLISPGEASLTIGNSNKNTCRIFRPMGSSSSHEMEVRKRQLAADEKLARELQEQLYQEESILSGFEIDANIALALLQDDQAEQASASGSHPVRNPRTRPRGRGSSQLPSRGREPRARAAVASRVGQRRTEGRSSRLANFGTRFPHSMAIDTRLDILEALEAASGDINNLGIVENLFPANNYFNENDYEALLALDENNDQGGASVHQINSLPQSVVQSESFEETCAVCLETAGLGETIRHLPCFHKFHKECIDPWLGRKSWCPICKSSITQS